MAPPVRNVLERFLEKTQAVESGCWEWLGWHAHGYGYFHLGGVDRRAHRVAYELFVGVIPEECVVMHSCDNPGCVNPDHLAAGSVTDNNRDRSLKGRWKGGRPFKPICPYGHPRVRVENRSGRCPTCERARATQRRLAKRVAP